METFALELAYWLSDTKVRLGSARLLKRVRCALISIILLQIANPAIAQQGVVRGVVISESLMPINRAHVRLSGPNDSATTDTNGVFIIRTSVAGPRSLRVRALGYEERAESIVVTPDSGWVGTITLRRSPQTLPEVVVRGRYDKPPEYANTDKYDDFFRRRKLGQGVFRSREDIERVGASNMGSVLQAIPGVTLLMTIRPSGKPEARFRMARCPGNPPKIAIYINGRLIHKLDGSTSSVEVAEIIESISVVDVLFVELYRGPSQIPSDLDRSDACAALVIWTR
jgi:hypothetical protein